MPIKNAEDTDPESSARKNHAHNVTSRCVMSCMLLARSRARSLLACMRRRPVRAS